MKTYSGEELKHMLEPFRIEGMGLRILGERLTDHLKEEPVSRICLLYGLAHTGKKTLMAQAIRELQDYENTCWIHCGPYKQDDVGDIHRFLQQHPSYRYIFIEDASDLEYDLDMAGIFYERYVKKEGRRVVLCSDNPLLFDKMGWNITIWDEKAERWDSLSSHIERIQTTKISYFECGWVMRKDAKKDYIEYCGFSDKRLLAGSDAYEDYIKQEIGKNIERMYKKYRSSNSWEPLLPLCTDGCLPEYAHYIIECGVHVYLNRMLSSWSKYGIDGAWKKFCKHLFEQEEVLHSLRGKRFKRYSWSAAQEMLSALQDMRVFLWSGDIDIPKFSMPSLCYHFIRRLFQEIEALQGADADEWRRFMAAADEMACKELAKDIELQSW